MNPRTNQEHWTCQSLTNLQCDDLLGYEQNHFFKHPMEEETCQTELNCDLPTFFFSIPMKPLEFLTIPKLAYV